MLASRIRFRFVPFVVFVALTAAFPLAAPVHAAEGKPRLGQSVTTRYRSGIEVTAGVLPCKGIIALTPVPFEWPEQQVRIVEEEVTPNVRNVEFRMVDELAKQMVIDIPYLAPGEEAKAVITYEVTRSWILSPEETSQLVVPKRMDRPTRRMLAPSPGIESRHPKIRKLAKEISADHDVAWEQVRAIYDWVRENVEYTNGPFKGAISALRDGDGDCEELSSLFIALCRSEGIPARTVWIPGHCYPEFYLQDAEGKGHWIPCQAAGDEAFGEMAEARPVMQKGDNFRSPIEKRKRIRYLTEMLRAEDGEPRIRTVRDYLGEVR